VKAKVYLPQANFNDFSILLDFRDIHKSLDNLVKLSNFERQGNENEVPQAYHSTLHDPAASTTYMRVL